MIVCGITGGIGSGKSYIRYILEEMGYPCFDSDLEAKKLYTEDSSLIDLLTKRYGSSIYNYDEGKKVSINKDRLASIIFNDKKELSFINGEVHPRLRNKFLHWVDYANSNEYKLVFIESALIFNSGLRDLIDTTILVTAPIDLRIKRATKRDNSTKDKILKRIEEQKSDDELLSLSDYNIINDEKQLLIPQMVSVISQILDF